MPPCLVAYTGDGYPSVAWVTIRMTLWALNVWGWTHTLLDIGYSKKHSLRASNKH